MHASLLSLALSALLVTAAPTSDASSGGLHKRLVVVNTPLFNGKPTTPGTQVQPGIWVGSDTIHICHIQCLNPANAQPVQAKCVTDKCLTGACEVASCVNEVVKSSVYVLYDQVTGYWGNEIITCAAPYTAPNKVCRNNDPAGASFQLITTDLAPL